MADIIKLNYSRGLEQNLGSLALADGSVRVTTDTKSLFFELDGARLEITDFITVENKDALDDILAPIAKKFYYVASENTLYKYNAGTASWDAIIAKIDPADIVDDLKSTDATKVLSANQGRQLQENIDGLIWSGTKEEYEIAKAAGEIKPGQLVNITDDDDITVIESSVTADSNNPVSSKGIYNALNAKVDKSKIATAVSEASTDDEVASAKAVHDAVENHVTIVDTALTLKAPLDSPALTGTPTAPTAAEGTNTQQLATTEFVMTAINAILSRMVTSLSDASTDDEIPTAKTVYDRINQLENALTGMMTEYTKFEDVTE